MFHPNLGLLQPGFLADFVVTKMVELERELFVANVQNDGVFATYVGGEKVFQAAGGFDVQGGVASCGDTPEVNDQLRAISEMPGRSGPPL